jgi:hypothetical protein
MQLNVSNYSTRTTDLPAKHSSNRKLSVLCEIRRYTTVTTKTRQLNYPEKILIHSSSSKPIYHRLSYGPLPSLF